MVTCYLVLLFYCRQLCVLVDAHHVYITIAQILLDESNLEFASLMVVSLNMILFTTKELHELRLELQNLATTVRNDVTNLYLWIYKFP